MQKLYGNYLGLCINNADPEYRGRVQIFIPHILPALYERWNQEGEDIKIEIIGNNLEDALSQEDIDQLKLMLPWSEAAAPVFGNSAAGHYSPTSGNFNQTSGTENENIAYSEGGNGSIGDFIFNREARRDANGNLAVYPINDGGGTYEVAGVNDGYHPEEAAALRSLIQQGRYGEAESRAKNYIINYTNSAVSLAANSGSELSLRDMAFNRGLGGANWIAKYAAGISPNTRMNDAARQQIINAQQNDPQGFLQRLREGAERYELDVVGLRPQFIEGLRNRWDARFDNSLALLNNSPSRLSLNDPFQGILPGSSNPAQHLPQLEPSNPTYLELDPNQQAILDAAANVGGGVPTPGTVDPNLGLSNWQKYRSSGGANCGVRARKFDHNLLKGTTGYNNFFTNSLSYGRNDGYGGANGSAQYWINSGYYTQATTIPPVLPFGTKLIWNKGQSEAGKTYGHIVTVADGRLFGVSAGENYNEYAQLNNGEVTVMLPNQKYADAFREKYGSDLPTYALNDVTNSGPLLIDQDPQIGDPDNPDLGDGTMARNPTSTQPTVTDTTGMPQGLFSVPNPGAMLWVFFREGDPLYPVYFAASYGAREWQNVMKAGSPGAHYPTAGDTTPRNQAIFRPNQAGGISFVDTITEETNARSIRMFHENGGHLEWHHHGSVLYSPNEHIQQVAGTAYSSCLNKEEWTQGLSNSVTIGDRITIVGNASQEALDYIDQHAQIVKDINKNMLKNGGGGSSGTDASSGSRSSVSEQRSNPIANFFGGFTDLVSGAIRPGQAPAAARPASTNNQSTPS